MMLAKIMTHPKTWAALLVGALIIGSYTSWAGREVTPQMSTLPRGERIERLEALIRNSRTPQEQAPWRYVLASTWQELGDTSRALSMLDGLNYPLLKERIAVKQAQLLPGDRARAKWQEVAQLNGTLRPEALYQLGLLGSSNSWEQLLTQPNYATHPRTAAALSQLLQQDPNNLTYLKLFIANFPDQPPAVRYGKQLESLTTLNAQEWEQLGEAYFQNREFNRAILAFNRGQDSPQALFNLGKSYQGLKRNNEAITVFNRLGRQYPQSPIAAQGQLLAVGLAPKNQRVLLYRQVASNFPTVGGTALWQAAKLTSGASQAQLHTNLIQRFPESEEASLAAWELAWDAAQGGNLSRARSLGEQALTQMGSDKYATPRIGFWAGRWAEAQGDTAGAKVLYRTVLKRFPASYYSWRSAVHLGLDAGDYQVRSLPYPIRPENAALLPGGSPTVKELARIGLAQEALAQLQAETYANRDPAPIERATVAALQAQMGQNLIALKQLLPLAYEDSPEVQKLHRERGFWEAAYPIYYWDTLSLWATQNRVNPLLALSLMRQESAFEPAIRSRAGALGLMQVMPATGNDIARQLGATSYSLTNPNDNIRFGTWYLGQTHDRWQNNSLLAVASYNAGPGNVAKWTKTISLSDPERFVEQIPFRETKGYVKSVFGNYWNYLRLYSPGFQEQVDTLAQGRVLVARN